MPALSPYRFTDGRKATPQLPHEVSTGRKATRSWAEEFQEHVHTDASLPQALTHAHTKAAEESSRKIPRQRGRELRRAGAARRDPDTSQGF